jgi:hypothetical protein
MDYFQKLPGYRREAPGLERRILRKLPVIALAGTLIPAFFVLASHWSPPTGVDVDVAKHLDMVDTIAIATVVTHWTAVLTAAIGCLVVMVMKGPAYVADRYDLKDSDRPLAPRDRAKDGD